MPALLAILITAALFFDFLNGVIGSSSIVATVITSRALSPRKALLLVAVAEFIGPFLFGTAVAMTLGRDLFDLSTIPALSTTLMGALGGATGWSLITWYFGWPSSTSHALVGGLVGAALAAGGPASIYPAGLVKVLIALFVSPVLGLGLGYVGVKILYVACRGATPSVNNWFKRLQIVTAVTLALSHSANDAQKVMGVMALSLIATGYAREFTIPWWVVALCALAIGLGTAVGGWRLIRTLGGKFYRIRPIHAFGSQLMSTAVILAAGLMGGPVSSTQVISSSIVGAGAADRLSKVRWHATREILLAWLFTIPLSGLLAAALYHILRLIL